MKDFHFNTSLLKVTIWYWS